MPCLFVRDKYHIVINEVNDGCEWVLEGEGDASIKWDGTCCCIRDGVYYKRRRARSREEKLDIWLRDNPLPPGWIHYDFDTTVKSGHGWVPVLDGPEDKLHNMADTTDLSDGTYELCGPRIQKNPEQLSEYRLLPHGLPMVEVPRNYTEIMKWMRDKDIEGIVFKHEDGSYAKIKKVDFGMKRKNQNVRD